MVVGVWLGMKGGWLFVGGRVESGRIRSTTSPKPIAYAKSMKGQTPGGRHYLSDTYYTQPTRVPIVRA